MMKTNDKVMANILILYGTFRKRETTHDLLYCYKKYSSHRCFYLNINFSGIPWYVKKVSWDLIIFHTIFLSSRWSRELFAKNMQDAAFLKQIKAVKVALPQDEFLNVDLVCDFINEFNITHVFSVAPESQWPVIYRTVDLNKVKMHKVLTGYLDDAAISKVKNIAKTMPEERPLDIGYRARRAAYWLGRHGSLKWLIADKFQEKAPQKGLITDISTRDEDTFRGDDWYRFLLNCKYQIGVDGGASILDWDGTYRKRTEEYLVEHPQATYEEVERECFPGVDGSLQLFALSPRHLEACLTRTCQILSEGSYNGVLIPGKHYIELKRDFSNLDEVLDIIKNDKLRESLTQNAWDDVVASGNYTYRSLVENVINTALEQVPPRKQSRLSEFWQTTVYYRMRLNDKLAWLTLYLTLLLIPIILRVSTHRKILRVLKFMKKLVAR